MRKVTEQIATAFYAGRAKSIGDTMTDGERVYLHGNLIAERIDPDSCTPHNLRLTLAGWNTPTTRERLNGILEVFNVRLRYAQRDFDPHLLGLDDKADDEIISADDWQYFSV